MAHGPYLLCQFSDLGGLVLSFGLVLGEDKFSTWGCIATKASFLVVAVKWALLILWESSSLTFLCMHS